LEFHQSKPKTKQLRYWTEWKEVEKELRTSNRLATPPVPKARNKKKSVPKLVRCDICLSDRQSNSKIAIQPCAVENCTAYICFDCRLNGGCTKCVEHGFPNQKVPLQRRFKPKQPFTEAIAVITEEKEHQRYFANLECNHKIHNRTLFTGKVAPESCTVKVVIVHGDIDKGSIVFGATNPQNPKDCT